jgi:hypothetical protein
MAPTAKSLALAGVKTAAAGLDRLRRVERGVVVLIYHRVGAGSGTQVDLPVDLFSRQMELLASEGRVVSIDEAVQALAAAEPPPRDPVVITFDDGTADFADVVDRKSVV